MMVFMGDDWAEDHHDVYESRGVVGFRGSTVR